MTVDGTTTEQMQAGRRFAEALADKRADDLERLLAPDIDFRGLTPGRAWEATGTAQVLEILLGHWFAPADVIEELVEVDTSTFADRQHVRYQLAGHDAEGPFVVEQQAYYMTDGDPESGRITWMRVLCSGFRTPAA